MTTLKTRPRKTLEDYLRLPDDVRAELIEGEILMSPAPTPRHQIVSMRLSVLLANHAWKHKLGEVLAAPVDVHLPSDDMVQPDLVFVAEANRSLITEKRIVGAPDLLVEILSPTHSERDLIVKRRLYASNGVKEYWIVDPETKSVERNLLSGSSFVPSGWFRIDETLVSQVLTGFAAPVRPIFE